MARSSHQDTEEEAPQAMQPDVQQAESVQAEAQEQPQLQHDNTAAL